MKITIILPVYGRSELLGAALESVKNQESEHWRLVIADDGSDEATQRLIDSWIKENRNLQVEWHKRPKNLGLFANLNQAISEAKADWVLLICSDDMLMPSAIGRLHELHREWPQARLILSTYKSVNSDGSPRPDTSALYHDKLSKKTTMITAERFVAGLLEWGSLNGNLTGMAFKRSLWEEAGVFREDWQHAADWEWLLRASSIEPLVLNREPVAFVRTHDGQLSNSNRRSGHELIEVAEVVKTLVNHSYLQNEPKRHQWAAHLMQFQLWNILKTIPSQPAGNFFSGLGVVHNSSGITRTSLALIQWLPSRWRQRKGKPQL